MNNCIFTSHCMESICDKSCPILAETSYLFERNNLPITHWVFSDDSSETAERVEKISSFLEDVRGGIGVCTARSLNSVQCADLVTYCAICKNWKGSQLRCNVYNFRYSPYLELVKKSWSMKSEPESLEYMNIWSASAKVLIVSNIDYVNFKDFEAQTLLNLLQSRQSEDKSTIIVSPGLDNLVGQRSAGKGWDMGQRTFFSVLLDLLKKSKEVIV